MAEHGAHLTSSGVDFSSRPSVFEVLAQESLAATIRPALKHAIKVFAEKYPSQLGSLYRFYDEIYLVLDGVLQHHYLKVWGASFAENFYSLQRISSGSSAAATETKLQKYLRLRSLACLVLIPYMKTKFDAWFEELQYKYPDSKLASVIQTNQPLSQRMSVLYLCLYPHLRSCWEFTNLLYQLSYMLKNGRWHSPSIHLAGVELTRALEEGEGEGAIASLGWTQNSDGSWSDRLHRLLRLSASTAAVCVSYSVSVSVFFLQFLDWWYTSDTRATTLTSLPIPQPPQRERQAGVALDESTAAAALSTTGQCPLCLKQLTNSTALSVSGYVFCYPCIHQYVRKHQCCPVTGFPSTEEHLVKIYEQDV